MASFITTHVLDAAGGRPAAGIEVVLGHRDAGVWSPVSTATTNTDGRCPDLGPPALPSGVYRLTFAVEGYFAASGTSAFYPEVTVTFRIDENEQHYHVPVLLSPFAYSTYRGS